MAFQPPHELRLLSLDIPCGTSPWVGCSLIELVALEMQLPTGMKVTNSAYSNSQGFLTQFTFCFLNFN